MTEKVIVVSGANGAIGQALVSKLVASGYFVIACVRNISDSIISNSNKVILYECNFADEESIKECTSKIAKEYKVIYGIVNCVGVAHGSSFLMTKPGVINEVFKINYFNVLYFTQNLVKRMLRAKVGVIVNLASTAGVLSDNGTTAYGGSKAALIHSSKVMARELGSFGIRVNAIAPTVVETPMAKLMDENSLQEIESRAFLKTKIFPAEIVDMIIYLLSDSAMNITGQVLTIDRGVAS